MCADGFGAFWRPAIPAIPSDTKDQQQEVSVHSFHPPGLCDPPKTLGIPWDLRLEDSARPIVQQSPCVHLSPPSAGITSTCHTSGLSYMGYGYQIQVLRLARQALL